MKNLIYKIMTSLRKPIKPLSPEEVKALLEQLTKYHLEQMDTIIKIAFTDDLKEIDNLRAQRLMIKERMSALKIKLLKSCDCGNVHIKDIENEERLKEMYSKKLLEFIHSDGKYY